MKLRGELFNLVRDLRKPSHGDGTHIMTDLKHHQCDGVRFSSSKGCDCELLIESCTEFSRNQTSGW